MQLYIADATMFLKFHFTPENMKKPLSKLLIKSAQTFF